MSDSQKNSPSQKVGENKTETKIDSKSATAALKQAEEDIKNDPDLEQKPDASTDLDEGELARFEGD